MSECPAKKGMVVFANLPARERAVNSALREWNVLHKISAEGGRNDSEVRDEAGDDPEQLKKYAETLGSTRRFEQRTHEAHQAGFGEAGFGEANFRGGGKAIA